MAEDIVISFLLRISVLHPFIKRFVSPSELILDALGYTAALGPAIAETESYPRMESREQTLEEWSMESPFHELIAMHSRAEPVAMSQTERLGADLAAIWLVKDLYPERLEIAIAPDIMVSLEEIDFDSGIHEFGQSPEHTHIPARNDIPVFIPEIPYIP